MPTQQESNSSVLAELYKYNPSALIELFELDLSPLQDYYTSKGVPITTTKYYFHNGYNQKQGTVDADVKWGNPQRTYLARPVQIDGVQTSSSGEIARPTLTVSNLDLFFTALCRSYANLVGAKITRIRTLAKFLNSDNFPVTNLLLNTQEFNLWSQTIDADTSVTANVTTAPDGTLTADKLFEATTISSSHGVAQDFAITINNANICCSVFLKASERTNAVIRFRNKSGSESRLGVNLSTGTISGTQGSVLGSGIQNMGNGWYRCWMVCSSSSGATTPNFTIYIDNNTDFSSVTYLGSPNNGIFVWGAQAEIITNATLTPTLYQAVGVTAGNPTADPNAKFPDDVYFIDRMAEEVPGQMTFELAPAWDVEGIQLPRRQIIANICPWTYKKDPCSWSVKGAVTINTITGTASATTPTTYFGRQTTTSGSGTGAKLKVVINTASTTYSTGATITVANPGEGYTVGDTLKVLGTDLGGATPTNDLTVTIASVTNDKYYDANDQIVATSAQDICGKRLTSCRIRFGTRVLPFGGFPSAGLYGKPI